MIPFCFATTRPVCLFFWFGLFDSEVCEQSKPDPCHLHILHIAMTKEESEDGTVDGFTAELRQEFHNAGNGESHRKFQFGAHLVELN